MLSLIDNALDGLLHVAKALTTCTLYGQWHSNIFTCQSRLGVYSNIFISPLSDDTGSVGYSVITSHGLS